MEVKVYQKSDLAEVRFWNELMYNTSFLNDFNLRLKELNPLSVCDIGSGFPYMSLMLLNEHSLRKVVCVDRESEAHLTRDFVANNFPKLADKKINSFAGFYFEKDVGKIKTIEEFNNIFLNYSFLNSNIENALDSIKEEFDLVICSNFLHSFQEEYIEHILSKIQNITRKNSLIFLKVEKKEWFDYNGYRHLLEKYFNGTIFEVYENGRMLESCFINIQYKN